MGRRGWEKRPARLAGHMVHGDLTLLGPTRIMFAARRLVPFLVPGPIATAAGQQQLVRFQQAHRKWNGSIALWITARERCSRLQQSMGLSRQGVAVICNSFLQQGQKHRIHCWR